MERKAGGIFRIAVIAALTTSIIIAVHPQKTSHEDSTPIANTASEPAKLVPAQSPVGKLPPLLRRICSCESTGYPNKEPRHFEADGSVKRGKINPQDTGMCQINVDPEITDWARISKELGFDVFTEDGNANMALWIYEKYGTQPWDWSAACWKN